MGFKDLTNGYDFPNESDTLSWGVGGTIDYDTPWGIHIKDILAYRKYSGDFSSFAGGSPLALDANYNQVSHHQFSEEAQFSGKLLDGALDWTAGAYYYTAYSKYFGLVDLPPFGLTFNQNDPIIDHNTSGFIHGVYHVDDQFSIEAGLRYSTEDKSYTYFRQDVAPGPNYGKSLFNTADADLSADARALYFGLVALRSQDHLPVSVDAGFHDLCDGLDRL